MDLPIQGQMTWFVHFDEKIIGPFPTEKILEDLAGGEISYSAYIWAKGQVEWVPISEWEENLENYSVAQAQKPDQLWKIRSGDHVTTSLTMEKAIDFLKGMQSFQQVFVSANDEEQWTPIYSSFMFMEALNMSRRNFLRAPLMGLAKITRKGSRFSYVVKTATIGQGGLGVYGLGPNFEPGTSIEIKVESEDLSSSLSLSGTIVYNTDKGFIGIRFAELSAESSAVILDYIHRFNKDSSEENQKAS